MTIQCPAQTYAATRTDPAEYCTNNVPEYGELCDVHDETTHADADYDTYLESLRTDA